MSSFGHQHHHGVRKNLVEGIGGLIVGAAAVLLLRQWLATRRARVHPVTSPDPTSPQSDSQPTSQQT